MGVAFKGGTAFVDAANAEAPKPVAKASVKIMVNRDWAPRFVADIPQVLAAKVLSSMQGASRTLTPNWA